MNKENKINLVSAIILTGFVVSVFFHYIKGAYLHLPYPHNTFLFTPNDRGNDFFNLLDWNEDLNPYFQHVPTSQYPFLNILSYLFGLINKLVSFIVYNVIVVSIYLYLNSLALYCHDKMQLYIKVFIISFLTYPFLFTIDRGNFESLLCVFLLLFIYFFQNKKYMISALFLSFAISMKLFPVVMIVLLVSEKKYKTAVITIIFTALITLFCLASFKGGLYANFIMILSGANIQNNSNILNFLDNNNLVQRGVTLFTFFKVLFCQFGILTYIDMQRFIVLYKILMIILSLFLFLYVIIIEKEFWKKVAVLVFIMLLFPQISADYKLIHIYIPLLLFVNASQGKKYDLFYTIMFSLLMIPKDYYLLYSVLSDSGKYDISVGVLINPMIMIVMMFFIIITGIKSTSRITIKNTFQEHLNIFKAVRLFSY